MRIEWKRFFLTIPLFLSLNIYSFEGDIPFKVLSWTVSDGSVVISLNRQDPLSLVVMGEDIPGTNFTLVGVNRQYVTFAGNTSNGARVQVFPISDDGSQVFRYLTILPPVYSGSK